MMLKVIQVRFFLILLLLTNMAGCRFVGSDIHITGANTVLKPAKALIAVYQQKNPELKINAKGNVTITFNLDKKQINMMAREMTLPEKIRANQRRPLKDNIIGYDAVAIIVHPANPVEKLSLNQVSQILKGEIRNWNEVGGEDAKMVVVSRDCRSGTLCYLKHGIMEGAVFSRRALQMKNHSDVIRTVSLTERGIGYVSAGYLDGTVKAVALAGDEGSPAVLPVYENIKNGSYPLVRPMHMLIREDADDKVKDFINFAYSPEGQEIIKKEGYLPVSEQK